MDKRILVPIIGAALIGGAVAGVGLTTFAATDSTSAPVASAMHAGFGPGVMGTVTAVSGSSITVSAKGGVYTIDASGATVEKYSGSTSSSVGVAGIAVGDTVSIAGTITSASMTAKDIRDGNPPKPVMPAAVGKVTAVSGSTITLSGFAMPTTKGAKPTTTTYTVDTSNATITKVTPPAANGDTPTSATISASQITVGDMLMVDGTASGTSITATTITDGASFGMGRGGGRKPVAGS